MLNFTRPYVKLHSFVGNFRTFTGRDKFPLKPGFHQRRKHNQKEHTQIQQRINHQYLWWKQDINLQQVNVPAHVACVASEIQA